MTEFAALNQGRSDEEKTVSTIPAVIVRHRVSLRKPDDRLQRTIQYAVMSRFISNRSGILNAPLSRGKTAEYLGARPLHLHAFIQFGADRTRR